MVICLFICIQVALDVLQTIVRSSKTPVSEQLVRAFPAAVHCTLNSDDNSTMQVMSSFMMFFSRHLISKIEVKKSYQ